MKTPINPFLGAFLIQLLRYLIVAGAAYLIFYVWKKSTWWHRKVVQRLPPATQMWREVAYSITTMLIFGIMALLVMLLRKTGLTQLYSSIEEYGWGYWGLSVVLFIFIHDTWFYFTHRWMHQPKVFKYFHRVHHLSHNPSPWAAFAFHPLEAVVEGLFFPLTVLFLPLHWSAILVFMLWMIVLNVLGHTGFEYSPKGWLSHWFGKWLNTPTHHAMHHQYGKGNYGLYFNLWDRLLGTNHPLYEQTFNQVVSRPKAE